MKARKPYFWFVMRRFSSRPSYIVVRFPVLGSYELKRILPKVHGNIIRNALPFPNRSIEDTMFLEVQRQRNKLPSMMLGVSTSSTIFLYFDLALLDGILKPVSKSDRHKSMRQRGKVYIFQILSTLVRIPGLRIQMRAYPNCHSPKPLESCFVLSASLSSCPLLNILAISLKLDPDPIINISSLIHHPRSPSTYLHSKHPQTQYHPVSQLATAEVPIQLQASGW